MTDDAERTAELRPAEADDPGQAGPTESGHVYGSTAGSDRPDKDRTLGRDLLASGALAVVLAALGFPYAMLWQVITPRVEFVTIEGGWVGVEAYPDDYVLADLYFAGIGLALGIIAAIAAWTVMRERRGPVVLLGLVVGSIACQVVAWRIGLSEWESFWEAMRGAPVGVHMWRPPAVLFVEFDFSAGWDALLDGNLGDAARGFWDGLKATRLGALAVMALAAVFVYTVCAGWSRRPSLRSGLPE